jgi:hypothetical protein
MPVDSNERGRTRNAWFEVPAVIFAAAVVYAILAAGLSPGSFAARDDAPLLILAAAGLIPLLRTASASWRPEDTGGAAIGRARVFLGDQQPSGQR